MVTFAHNNYLRGVPVSSISKAGFPLQVSRSNSADDPEDIEWFLKLGDYHYYYRSANISSQYCRIQERRQGKTIEYIADHGDLYDDLDSLVKAVEAEIQDYKKTSIEYSKLLDENVQESNINLVVIYPIMVFSGGLYECRQTKKSVNIRPVDHMVFMRRIQSRTIKGEFFIDFICESYLNRYLGLIEKELKEIEKRLRRHRRLLRKSVIKQLRSLSPKTEL